MWLCILYTGWCKQQPKMWVSCFTSAAEKEKCWGFEVGQFFITRLSVHSLGLLCWLSGEWKQKQRYKGIMFIETLKKESGEWLFLPCEKSSMACLFSLVKTLSLYLLPHTHGIIKFLTRPVLLGLESWSSFSSAFFHNTKHILRLLNDN